MAPAISKKPLLSDLVAQIGKVPSTHIRPVGDLPDLANVDNESGAGIPLIDLKMLNATGPERRKVVEAIRRACESDGFFMVTKHGVPAAVVDGMLHVALESERLKCYSDDPKKAIRLSTSFNVRTEKKVNSWRDYLRLHRYPLESFVDQWPSNPQSFRQVEGTYDATEAKALALRLLEDISESLVLERSHMVAAMGRHGQHMAVNYYYPPCPQPELAYGLPGHKDHNNAITQLLQDHQDGVSGLQVQHGGRWVAMKPVHNSLVINMGDLLQATRLSSTGFNVMRPDCYPVESSFVDQWPSNPPPSSFRAACNVSWENIHHAIHRCVHKLGCSSPSYCLPITVNDPSPYGSETQNRPFLPPFIEKNDANVEDVSKFHLAAIAGTLSLLVPTAINIDELTTTWAPKWKVLCGSFMIMSLILAFIGLFTVSFRAGSRARNLSSHCARMSFVVANIVFMLLIASNL